MYARCRVLPRGFLCHTIERIRMTIGQPEYYQIISVGLLRSRITKHRIGRRAVRLPYVVSLINIVKIPNIDD
jgi:hypothetical protein